MGSLAAAEKIKMNKCPLDRTGIVGTGQVNSQFALNCRVSMG